MSMQEHVARTLCAAASKEHQPVCPVCERYREPCSMWPQFMNEADAAISAVRDFARLDMRRKPRIAA